MTAQGAGVSGREAEVLSLLGMRLSNAQIASRLHISVRTVESHVSSLLRKYGVADRSALASLAGPSPEGAPTPGLLAGLPRPRTTFIGRGHECDSVTAGLRDERLVTLLGPGGVGKTRLATAVAAAAAPSFPFGGAFVDLVPVGAGFVAQAVGAALGVAESPRQPLTDAIVQRLGRGPALLVLDNCEHLVDAVAEFVERVLSGCPEVTVLATSRERLAVPGERVVPVAPLPLASDAERLFQERAAAVDPAFTANPAVVAEVCSRLDGMPLAIELAAARAPALGADILAALDDSLRLLSGGRGANQRHQSLRAVIDWSYRLLADDERTLLRRLAVFAGPFDLAAAVAVLPDRDPAMVADILGRLVDKSMLVHQRGAQARWRLLETIRAFAGESLAESAEHAEVHGWHLRWAAGVATQLESRHDDGWRDDFDTVAADLRVAVARCARDQPDEVGHRLARSLGRLAYARRFLTEAAQHHRQAGQLATTARDAARDLRSAAECALQGADPGGQAFEWLLASADHAQAAGDGDTRAVALARAVEVACRFHSDPATEVPRERLRQLLDDARACGDADVPLVRAHLAVAAAWAAGRTWRAPDPDLALAAAEVARQAGDPLVVSASLDAVSTAATRAGRPRQAHQVASERLAVTASMSRRDPDLGTELADALHMAATYAIAAGDLPAALAAARRLHTDELVGSHPYTPVSRLVTAFALTGQFDEALDRAADMWTAWQRAGSPVAPAMVPAVLSAALSAGLQGDETGYDRWRRRAAQVVRVDEVGQDPGVAPFAAFVEARVAVHTGQTAAAAAVTTRAFADYPLSRHETYARAAGAELAVVASLPDAADLLAAAAPAADQNDWAAACLARAKGRLHRDLDALAESVRLWDRIGARFEHEQTRHLITAIAPGASPVDGQRSRHR